MQNILIFLYLNEVSLFFFKALLLQGRESTGEEGLGVLSIRVPAAQGLQGFSILLPQLFQPVCAGGKLGKLGQGDDPTKAFFFFFLEAHLVWGNQIRAALSKCSWISIVNP